MKKEFKLWEDIENELNKQFPKGKCKERGNALVLYTIMHLKFEEFIKLIKEWTFKNNTIKFKNSNLGLAVLDGGLVNVIELHNEINKLSGLNEEEID